MSCFIHKGQEGVAVCRQCGKNMCVECSSLVGHSGLCPTCYRPELVNRIHRLDKERKHIILDTVIKVILFIVLIWTIILPIIYLVKFIKNIKRLGVIPVEIEDCATKIRAIDRALAEGKADI